MKADYANPRGCIRTDYANPRGCIRADYANSNYCIRADYTNSRGCIMAGYANSRGFIRADYKCCISFLTDYIFVAFWLVNACNIKQRTTHDMRGNRDIFSGKMYIQ